MGGNDDEASLSQLEFEQCPSPGTLIQLRNAQFLCLDDDINVSTKLYEKSYVGICMLVGYTNRRRGEGSVGGRGKRPHEVTDGSKYGVLIMSPKLKLVIVDMCAFALSFERVE